MHVVSIPALLITWRQSSPSVAFMRLVLFPEDVSGKIVPPNSVVVKRFQPFPKRGGQLMVGVTWEDELRLEH